MDRGTSLLVSGRFSSIGAGYALSGRKQRPVVPWLTGRAFCGSSYCVSTGYALVGGGRLWTAGPWCLRG